MSKHQKHFNSKFPIVCSGMNKVSDINLALAVRQQGCYPSLVAFNHLAMDEITDRASNDPTLLDKALTEYSTHTGDSEYILGVSTGLLRIPEMLDVISKHKPSYLELFDTTELKNLEFFNVLKKLQSQGIKILLKTLYPNEILKYSILCSVLDGVVIKGSKAAGRVSLGETDLIEDVKKLRAYRSDWIIIAQGGVHDSAGIRELIDAGADVASMGTVFALSEESSIPTETKLKMMASSYADTVKIGQANQSALVFTKTDNDVENNTIGLTNGLKTATSGHVFVGAALDHISQIKPVSQIVAELTSGL